MRREEAWSDDSENLEREKTRKRLRKMESIDKETNRQIDRQNNLASTRQSSYALTGESVGSGSEADSARSTVLCYSLV